MILAETTPPPGLNQWLACLFYIAGGVYVLMKIGKHLSGKPPAGELDLRVNTLEHDLEKHEKDDDKFHDSIRDDIKELRLESDRGRRRLYRRTDNMNSLLQRVAEKLNVRYDPEPIEEVEK
jgi:hypothetical protein